MKVVGIVVLLIAVSAIAIFGMGALSSMMDSGDATINASSDMYDSYTAAKNVTSTSFGFLGFMPYLLGLGVVIAVVLVIIAMIPK